MTEELLKARPPFSSIVNTDDDSMVGQLLKLTARPDIISFGGGLPSPEGFPVEALAEAADWVLKTRGRTALQYSLAEGEKDLRECICARHAENGIDITPDQVQVVSGSQQALDLIARAFCDPGSKILVERPTYMGALSAFGLVKPVYRELPADAGGLDPEKIGEEARGAKFAYVMPTFANPTGLTIGAARREALARKAREYDFWIVEDDPYGELWYDAAPPPSMLKYAPERTLRLGTYSKVLAPGLRLGYVIGPAEVISALRTLKQAVDLHTSPFTQQVSARVLSEGLLATHLPKVRALYRSQCQVMLDALDEFMPRHPEISWTRPEGGMFIWMHLPEGADSVEMMKKGLARGVSYVPGDPFYAGVPEKNHLRLSFVTVPPETIRAGVKILAEVVRESLA